MHSSTEELIGKHYFFDTTKDVKKLIEGDVLQSFGGAVKGEQIMYLMGYVGTLLLEQRADPHAVLNKLDAQLIANLDKCLDGKKPTFKNRMNALQAISQNIFTPQLLTKNNIKYVKENNIKIHPIERNLTKEALLFNATDYAIYSGTSLTTPSKEEESAKEERKKHYRENRDISFTEVNNHYHQDLQKNLYKLQKEKGRDITQDEFEKVLKSTRQKIDVLSKIKTVIRKGADAFNAPAKAVDEEFKSTDSKESKFKKNLKVIGRFLINAVQPLFISKNKRLTRGRVSDYLLTTGYSILVPSIFFAVGALIPPAAPILFGVGFALALTTTLPVVVRTILDATDVMFKHKREYETEEVDMSHERHKPDLNNNKADELNKPEEVKINLNKLLTREDKPNFLNDNKELLFLKSQNSQLQNQKAQAIIY